METKDEGSTTRDYGAFRKTRDQEAARRLWERYYDRLCRLARRHLRSSSRRMADDEDVASTAFDSFCAAAVKGRFRAGGPGRPLEDPGEDHSPEGRGPGQP